MTTAGSARPPAISVEPISVRPDEAGQQREPEPGGPDHVDAPRPSRGVPARRRRPADQEGHEADRHVDEEHVAPGRGEELGPRAAQAGPGEGVRGVDRPEDGRADERPGGHPEERQRPDDPEGARAGRSGEEMRGRGRADRDEHAATEPLDETGRDELVHRLGEAGQRRPDHEDRQGAEERAASAPQVGHPAGERHRQDVDEQVAVDDPARLAQLDPGGGPVRVGKVVEDRRQRDGRDQQLHAGEEHARHRRRRAARARTGDPWRGVYVRAPRIHLDTAYRRLVASTSVDINGR